MSPASERDVGGEQNPVDGGEAVPVDPVAGEAVPTAGETTPVDPAAPHAHRFGPLPEAVRRRWAKFCAWEDEYFPNHIGMVVEDLRCDYARLRLPWREILRQREGVLHGGLIAALVDTCVVPAIATHYEVHPRMATVHLGVQYLRPVVDRDIVAEAWVEHRGRSMVYCRAEVRSVGADGEVELAASASLVFRVSSSASASPVRASD